MTASRSMDAGAVLYAKDMSRLSDFYLAVAGLFETQRGGGFVMLERGGFQLVVHAVPERTASAIKIAQPPRRRSDTPVKLVFCVADLDRARRVAEEWAGAVDEPSTEWTFGDWRVCDGYDPEGNVFQLREKLATRHEPPSAP